MTRLAVLTVTALALCSCATDDRIAQPSTSPKRVTREFYNWYLHARFPDPGKENATKFGKYITQRFLKEAKKEWDMVVFIDAQDADPTWANDFRVSQPTARANNATVDVDLRGKKVHATLRATLRHENGGWKIDNVKKTGWKVVGAG